MHKIKLNFKNVAHVGKYCLLPMLLIFFLVFASCNDDKVDEPEKKSDLKEMTDVEITAGDHNFIVAKQSDDKTFKFTVPVGFDLQLLSKTKVVFKLSEGALSNRLSGSEINFTSVESIDITVTAEDKSTKVYTIEKEVELSSDAKILAFALKIGTEKFEGVVNETEGKVTFTLAYKYKEGLVTAIPEFSISPSASVNFASGDARDFSNPVLYEVTSQDNTKRTWEIIVNLETPSKENNIFSFKLRMGYLEFEGNINESDHTISFVLPDIYSDYVKTGHAITEISEFANISPASGSPMTFVGNSPYNFTYTVTAQDGVTKQEWKVQITVKSEPELGEVITIGNVDYNVASTKLEKIDDGFWYFSAKITDSRKPLVIHTVRYDISSPGYSIETWVGNDSITGRNSPSAMVNRYEQAGREVRMAINGGFYGMVEGGTPISTQKINGVLTFTPFGRYPIIGFDAQNSPYLDSIRFNSQVRIAKNNATRRINTINPDMRWTDQLVLYNSYKGKRTGTNQYGVEILCTPVSGQWENLSSHINVSCRVEKITRSGESANMEIPKGSIVLSGHGASGTFLNALQVDDLVDVTVDYFLTSEPTTNSNIIRNMVHGWSIILNKNVIQAYYNWNGNTEIEPQNHPRTAVGFTADKKHVYFTVVEGREPGVSVGVTTRELAQVMRYFGATNAINLDGGGSSCMVVDKQLKNTITGGTWQRPVADGLAIIRR